MKKIISKLQVWVPMALVGAALGCGAALFQGCGGGANGLSPTSSGATAPAVSVPAASVHPAATPVVLRVPTAVPAAGISIRIVWPPRPVPGHGKVTGRVVPIEANTIAIDVIQRVYLIDHKLAIRPATGNVSLVYFDRLPADRLIIKATAYPGINAATGIPQAMGQTIVTTQAGARADVGITMISTVTKLAITPANPIVEVGKAIQLVASSRNAQGQVVMSTPDTLRWASADPTIAIINATGNGTVEGVKRGTTKITVTDTESKQTATVTVNVIIPIDHIEVAPATATVAISGALSLTATARDVDGNALPVPPEDFNWTSTDPTIVTVTAAGNPVNAIGAGVGTTQITVTETESQLSASMSVTVINPTPTPNGCPGVPNGCVCNFGQACNTCGPGGSIDNVQGDCSIGCSGACEFTAPH